MGRTLKIAALVTGNLAFVALILGVSEFWARSAYRKLGPNSRRPELVLDRWSAYRNEPNYSRRGVRHNAAGFRRDTEVSLEEPPDTIRIFLLGGSVAYGGESLYPEIDRHGTLDNHETIDYYLERKLNSTFPTKHWEVINAAVKGYLLHQDMALFLAALQRYRPDYVISLDGANDVFLLLRDPGEYGTFQAGFLSEFNQLTNPQSLSSLRLFLSVWLVNNSALCRMMRDRIRDRAGEHNRMKRAAAATISAPGPSVQYEVALKKLDVYRHTIQQFHRLLNLDGVQDVFTLQPEIAVSRKQFGDTETKIFDYYRRLEGEASVYGFQRLYPELNRRLSTDSQREGYRFVDLTNVFDDMTIQAFTDYCHLTPAGNHAVAEALFKSLSASFREKAAAP